MQYYSVIYIVFFVCAIVFSFLINSLFLKFSKNLGARKNNGNSDPVIRWNREIKPSLGGISFYILFLLSLTSYLILFGNHEDVSINKQFIGILASSTLAFLMGLADDAYDTIPLLKFFTQLCCGIIMLVSGICINFFPYIPLNYALTIFWVVGIMNAINMIDNMDAIAAIISVFIVAATIAVIVQSGNIANIHLLLLIGILSALLGFLFFNWHPAKMFMGDTGSQFLGAFLSAMGIIYFWNFNSVAENAASVNNLNYKNAIMAVIIFIAPIADTATVVYNRLSSGKSPFIGGKDHTTHHLCYLGFSNKNTAMIFTGICFMSACLILWIIFGITNWTHLHTLFFTAYCFIIFGLLFYTTKIKSKKH